MDDASQAAWPMSWLPQVLSLLEEGTPTGFWGLACPPHCRMADLGIILVAYLAGLACGLWLRDISGPSPWFLLCNPWLLPRSACTAGRAGFQATCMSEEATLLSVELTLRFQGLSVTVRRATTRPCVASLFSGRAASQPFEACATSVPSALKPWRLGSPYPRRP